MVNRDFCTIIFLFAFIFMFPITLDGEETPVNGNFRWALGCIMPDDSFHTITGSLLIKSQPENELFLYFLPISNSYLYLFTISSQQELRLIFPDNFSMFNKVTYHYKPYEFHKADILPFDSTCMSETYMLVSTRRLKKFERLVLAYNSAHSSRKIRLFADILMELTRLRYQRYLAKAPVIPWETSSFPSDGETAQGMQIKLLAQQFNYYFITVVRYECE